MTAPRSESQQAGPEGSAGKSSNPEIPPTGNGTFKSKPTNFLLLSVSDTSIQGEFVIDPSIRLPPYLLPPLDGNEQRKNLSLTSTGWGNSVDADIWLLPAISSLRGQKVQRSTVALASDHGSIHARLRTLEGAAPCLLTCRAPHGSVRLALPRSFRGLLGLSTHPGSIRLSDTLTRNVARLSRLTSAQWYFVGDLEALGENTWEGDIVEIDAQEGSVHLNYVDEEVQKEETGIKGLFSRILSSRLAVVIQEIAGQVASQVAGVALATTMTDSKLAKVQIEPSQGDPDEWPLLASSIDGAAPFALTARCAHGSVRLALPRAFHGLLSLSTWHGNITLSDAPLKNAMQLGHIKSTRRYFIGDVQAMGEGVWEVYQVDVEAPHGSIRLSYVDEEEEQSKVGLFGRLFGK